MNFFAHQDDARSRTTRLLVLFVLAVLAIVAVVYATFLAVSPAVQVTSGAEPSFDLWRPDLLFASFFGITAIIGFATFVKVKSLGDGGSAVAESVGGRPVAPGTTDPAERRLLNVVEEMAIASGVPMPAVYVLPDERGINAFAAGYELGDAAVAVTRGALHVLTRSELQAVVAHEFSHILNGDMRLNIRLIGVLYGLMMLGTTGGWLFRSSLGFGGHRRRIKIGGRNEAGGAAMVAAVGLVVWAIGSLGVFFGRLIQRAVSRQREFLADASAVQFTRDPVAMAGALKKIGGYAPGARVHAREASELSHLFFGEALGRSFNLGGLLATHPPLSERIRRLDPGFDGSFPAVAAPDSLLRPGPPAPDSIAAFVPEGAAMSMSLPGVRETQTFDAGTIVEHVGAPTPEHIEYTSTLVGAIPKPLYEATRSGLGAVALTYVLLLDPEDEAQARHQLEGLRSTTHPNIFAELERLEPYRAALHPRARLPLLEVAMNGLRQLSPGQYEVFRQEVSALAVADSRLALSEFAIQKSLIHWLDSAFGLRPRRPVQYYAIRALVDELSLVLSALAHVGHRDVGAAMTAFQLGVARFRLLKPGEASFLSPAQCSFDRLDRALEKLSMTTPALKSQVIDACAHCVLADQEVEAAEAELLRVIADSMGCPIPPFLPSAATVQSAMNATAEPANQAV